MLIFKPEEINYVDITYPLETTQFESEAYPDYGSCALAKTQMRCWVEPI